MDFPFSFVIKKKRSFWYKKADLLHNEYYIIEQESHYNILRYLKKKKILRCTESVRLEMF